MQAKSILSEEQVQAFRADGYVIIRNFFSKAEIAKLYGVATADDVMQKNALNVTDKSGKNSKLSLWFTPGDDVFGLLSRSERMVHGAAQVLDSDAPVCHFHSKLMQKEPRVGGAWEWHQDYGYWYKNQFMFPDQMVSIMVALTEANAENGCLQVIKGSHKLGRVNHGFSGEQVGADAVFVEHALSFLEHVWVVLQPGDALFFHSNLLHRSEANLSEHPRWSIICCYNSQSNPAFNEMSTAYNMPVNIVPDVAILEAAAVGVGNSGDFLRKENDPALKETGWEKTVETA
jgi:ectoine hydroxylase-related dioxygenase (phytanoyl-CoA dioxygenase family)